MKKIIRPDFLVIPYALIEDERVTKSDMKVYSIVYFFSRLKNKKCTASNLYISEMANMTSGSVANSLRNLDSYGYIRRTFKDAAKRNRKEIIPLVGIGFDTSASVSDTSTSVSLDTSADEQKKKSLKKKRKEEPPITVEASPLMNRINYSNEGVYERPEREGGFKDLFDGY